MLVPNLGRFVIPSWNIVPVLVQLAFNRPTSQGSPGRTALPLQLHYVPRSRPGSHAQLHYRPGSVFEGLDTSFPRARWDACLAPRFLLDPRLVLFGFGGCIATARSGAELAAALLLAGPGLRVHVVVPFRGCVSGVRVDEFNIAGVTRVWNQPRLAPSPPPRVRQSASMAVV